MKKPCRVSGAKKLELCALILFCLIGGFGCSEGGSSTELEIEAPNAVIHQEKSTSLRKGVCWNNRSRLKEVNRPRLRNSTNKRCAEVSTQRKLKLLLVSNE